MTFRRQRFLALAFSAPLWLAARAARANTVSELAGVVPPLVRRLAYARLREQLRLVIAQSSEELMARHAQRLTPPQPPASAAYAAAAADVVANGNVTQDVVRALQLASRGEIAQAEKILVRSRVKLVTGLSGNFWIAGTDYFQAWISLSSGDRASAYRELFHAIEMPTLVTESPMSRNNVYALLAARYVGLLDEGAFRDAVNVARAAHLDRPQPSTELST